MFCNRCGSVMPSTGMVCTKCGTLMTKEQLDIQRQLKEDNKNKPNQREYLSDKFGVKKDIVFRKEKNYSYVIFFIIFALLVTLLVILFMR